MNTYKEDIYTKGTTMILTRNLLVMAFSLLLLQTGIPYSQNSSNITLTGRLLDQGNPVGIDGPVTIDVQISLFDQETGGDPQYTESFLIANSQGITVDDGEIMVHLGSGTSSDNLTQVVNHYNNLWVEMTVDGDVLSRTPLSASPRTLIPNSSGPDLVNGSN